MTTKLNDSMLERETFHVVGGRPLIVTLTPGGVRLHPKGTRQSVIIGYDTLYAQLKADERRGGQSDICIKARRGK